MKTTVDWFRFRTQAQPLAVLEALRPMFGTLGPDLELEPLGRGILGFEQACSVRIGDQVKLGRLDFGGESQRGWVRADFGGQACQWVQDWDCVEAVEQLDQAEIKRLDVALTTWDGSVTHERVMQAYEAGLFAGESGRPPKARQIVPSDPRDGRTVEVGSRKGDKFVRCYEKGWEMLKDLPEETRNLVTSVEGHPPADIYRCELELKAGDRDIPWEVIERRDQYFAGAYPFFGELLPNVEVDLLKLRPERQAQRSLESALAHLRQQWGRTLFTALHAYHGDMGAVWSKIVGRDHSQDLIDAGVLLVDHE